MILVRLMGGLGNQMFQYAAARAVSIRNKTSLKIDLTLLDINKKREHSVYTHRDLDLEIFNVHLEKASPKEIEYFNGKFYRSLWGKIYNRIMLTARKKKLVLQRSRNFDPSILKLGNDKCMVGSWQSEKYFKDQESSIRKDFTFRVPLLEVSADLVRDMRTSNAVCVNVRRGDYVTSPIYSKTIGALSAIYHNNGIAFFERTLPGARFFVFSDDIEWCRENLHFTLPVTFVGHEHAGKKFGNYLQLMCECKHFLIANSTFSWWSAYLGEKKGSIILAPVQWTRSSEENPADIIPEHWKKMETIFE
jgi:hypothetical protein